ncbi:tyrosinase family protein [Flavobacterium branchiarum]|uniref:Tyrosinase family protein n=1 Tax=Flavobacterium branchiarum TaxID=1114870 RepID=A0ABV5FP10_9FLAO|nr:tyrosinase family protein [Flavobacterium branchiarum]MDN3671833.1 tyrosinase family protein [Flavobacterium branchiarum]
MPTTKLNIRKSIAELQRDYESGNKTELENLMRAWKGIKELPAENEHSFFRIGGFHGEPFRGAGWGSSAYWGGYCNHGNVLFPTWHRVYILKIEQALQSIEGCKTVMLPYWDETDEESLKKGIPKCLTDEFFVLDGKKIANPLRSFIFPKNIVDNIQGENNLYNKPKGYETVRYPLSGLVGTEKDRAETDAHNAKFPDYNKNVAILNDNVLNWLNSFIIVKGKKIETNVNKKFRDCLNAPNFTVFSNTTSVSEWNANLEEGQDLVVSLESPHNSIHLAVGGCDLPTYDRSPIPGANGDMGENDTAGLDPIFYFHHCNIDRVFWLWQKKHGFTDHLEIFPEYPGTNTVDSQGPTPGMAPNSWLNLESPLNPFTIIEDKKERPYNSLDCINIEKQLGLTYSVGSLEESNEKKLLANEEEDSKIIKVSRINKAPIRGSFLISAFVMVDGKKEHLGTEAVLSRWSSQYCANCQTHLEVKAFFKLPIPKEDGKNLLTASLVNSVEIEIYGRDGQLNDAGNGTENRLFKDTGKPPVSFHMEIV